MKNILLTLLVLVGLSMASVADDALPPSPQAYFNDYAGLVTPDKASQLNQRLVDFDKSTTTQIVVAVFPALPDGQALEDYTQRVAHSWGVGTKDKSNGVVLFVFRTSDNGHTKIRIEVGYGLEGAIPDATANRIIQDQIIPHFKSAKNGGPATEWATGLEAGINSLMAASKGDYKPVNTSTSSTNDDASYGLLAIFLSLPLWAEILIVAALIIIALIVLAAVGGMDGSGGGGYYGGSDGGSSWGGGSSSGGGDFGGGGASGDC